MCARQLLLSTRILCSLARPELGAAPMKRWIAGSTGLVAFLCKVVVCRCERAHVFCFFLLMLPRYLMVHGRKGLTQPESSLSGPFFYYYSTEVVSQCTQPKLGSFRLDVYAFLQQHCSLSLLSLLTLHQNPATNHLSTLAYVESLSGVEQLFFFVCTCLI